MLWHSSRFSLIPLVVVAASIFWPQYASFYYANGKKSFSILGHMRCGILMSQLYKYFNSFQCYVPRFPLRRENAVESVRFWILPSILPQNMLQIWNDVPHTCVTSLSVFLEFLARGSSSSVCLLKVPCVESVLYIEENLLNTINICFMFANEKAPSEAETIIIKIAKRTKQIISTDCLFMTSHTVNYSNICALFSLLICIKQYALLHTHTYTFLYTLRAFFGFAI